jgi:hypothetical protein
MSPIVDGVPQRIDTAVVIAHLQRRMHDAVNGSDLRKVREWLEVRGPVNCDNYQMAGYLQAVASKTGGWHSFAWGVTCLGWKQGGGSGCRGQSGSVSGVAAASWMMRRIWSGGAQR